MASAADNPFSKENYYGGKAAEAAASSAAASGALHIKAAAGQLLWASRFVRLDGAAQCLLCFKSEAASKSGHAPKSKVTFSTIDAWDGKPNGFMLTTALGRKYHVYADTADAQKRWQEAIEASLKSAATEKEAKPARGRLHSVVPTGGEALVGSGTAGQGAGATGVAPLRRSVSAGAAEATAAPGTGAAATAAADMALLQKEAEDLRQEVATLKAQLAAVGDAGGAGTGADALGTVAEDGAAAATSVAAMPPPAIVPAATKAAARRKRGSALPDGTFVEIAPDELKIMRAIFELYDERRTGRIGAADVQRLHAALGEPLADAEAKEAIRFMGAAERRASIAVGAGEPKGAGESVDFASFVKWWHYEHRPDERGSRKGARYAAKFKFIKARVANPDLGKIVTKGTGAFPSFEFRVEYHQREVDAATGAETMTQISPWHDVPLNNPDGSYNFICEIPKWTRRKMEIATGEGFNPIKQDTKNGKLREYKWGDMMFNYGAMPQTWEDPAHVTEPLGTIGDNDPIDVVEIGVKQWPMGAIVEVKVLGVLALIDEGETDWKVICISVQDPMAAVLHDVEDVEAHIPGCITAIHDWLRDYKAPKINEYGFDGQCMDRAFAEAAIQETHEFWEKLVAEKGADSGPGGPVV
eukprot:g298.t1